MSAFRVSPSQLATLSDVIRSVTRVSGLSAEDADDFSQHVHLRLLERNYEPLARFAGRSSFRTYLFVVVKRLLLDWRNAQAGKWRPSALATRLGPLAVGLDRLMSRDGCSRDEAIAVLSADGSAPGGALLRELAERIPQR